MVGSDRIKSNANLPRLSCLLTSFSPPFWTRYVTTWKLGLVRSQAQCKAVHPSSLLAKMSAFPPISQNRWMTVNGAPYTAALISVVTLILSLRLTATALSINARRSMNSIASSHFQYLIKWWNSLPFSSSEFWIFESASFVRREASADVNPNPLTLSFPSLLVYMLFIKKSIDLMLLQFCVGRRIS